MPFKFFSLQLPFKFFSLQLPFKFFSLQLPFKFSLQLPFKFFSLQLPFKFFSLQLPFKFFLLQLPFKFFSLQLPFKFFSLQLPFKFSIQLPFKFSLQLSLCPLGTVGYSQPAAWTTNRSLLVASHVKAFPGRPTNFGCNQCLHLALGKCSGISRNAINPWLCPACLPATASFPSPTQP